LFLDCIAIKHCPYCGAKYSDDIIKCPIDEQPLVRPSVVPSHIAQINKPGKNISPAPTWVTILTPKNNFEADIVMGRLYAAGIRARLDRSEIGGWKGRITFVDVQVRAQDHDAAKELLKDN